MAGMASFTQTSLLGSPLPSPCSSHTSSSQRTSLPTPSTSNPSRRLALPIAQPRSFAVHRTLLIMQKALPPGLEDHLDTLQTFPGATSALLLPLKFALATIAAYVAACYPTRPRGRCPPGLLEVRDSVVQGRGVFALKDIEPGTVIGTYPGRPRSAQEMTAKCVAAPLAQYYCFKNSRGELLDPTGWTGSPCNTPVPGLPWWPIDPTLAYVNEPVKGGRGVNVTVEDDPKDESGLIFEAVCFIPAGGEIFVDYGLDYDRSGYGGGDSQGGS